MIVRCTQRSVRAEGAGPGQSTGFPCPLQYINFKAMVSCDRRERNCYTVYVSIPESPIAPIDSITNL